MTMLRAALAVMPLLIMTSVPVQSRPHSGDGWSRSHYGNYYYHHGQRRKAYTKKRHRYAKAYKAKRAIYRKAPKRKHRRDDTPPRTIAGYQRHLSRPGKSTSLVHVISPLAVKAREIVSACGSRVVSAYRPGARVRGSGRRSLHSMYPSRAIDIVGNPKCIAQHLRKWPGGKSNDYHRVAHYHVSYNPGGSEWGRTFAHYRPTRFARRGRPS